MAPSPSCVEDERHRGRIQRPELVAWHGVVSDPCLLADRMHIRFFVRGREAAFPFYPVEPPTDAAVIGIVDRMDA